MGQKLYRKPEELRINEEVYHNYLNALLDAKRHDEAFALSSLYKEGKLTSIKMIEIMAFDGSPIGTGIEDETVEEEAEEQLLAQARIEQEGRLFLELGTPKDRVNQHPVLGEVRFTPIGKIPDRLRYNEGCDFTDIDPVEEQIIEGFATLLFELSIAVEEGRIDLETLLEELSLELGNLDEYLYGEDE